VCWELYRYEVLTLEEEQATAKAVFGERRAKRLERRGETNVVRTNRRDVCGGVC
jgi:hypothetical protein